jgi:hypothetical protein
LLPPAVARADPSAVEASWFEARDTVDGDCAMPAGACGTPAGDVATDTALGEGPVAPAGPGVPQTSQ